MRPVIVIPIPKMPTQTFLRALPKDVPIIVIDDSDGGLKLDPHRFTVIGKGRQKQLLGPNFPGYHRFRHSSSCRNLGHYLAYKEGYDVIITLDYDCVVPKDFIAKHLAALGLTHAPFITSENGWVNPLNSSGWYSRGYPYEKRYPVKTTTTRQPVKVVLNMGLWQHVVDINGIDKVALKPPSGFPLKHGYTAVKDMFPISGMNNAFIKDITPAYFFLPNVTVGNWELSRHDDIWGGYILKRLIDKHGDHATFGKPVVYHSRQSWLPGVLAHEHYMHLLNQSFYTLADEAVAATAIDSYQNMFAEFTAHYRRYLRQRTAVLPPHYARVLSELGQGLEWWVSLFKTQS
jgi:hypothetical protein